MSRSRLPTLTTSPLSRPGRSYAQKQAAKNTLFAADNAGAVSKESLAIFSSESGRAELLEYLPCGHANPARTDEAAVSVHLGSERLRPRELLEHASAGGDADSFDISLVE